MSCLCIIESFFFFNGQHFRGFFTICLVRDFPFYNYNNNDEIFVKHIIPTRVCINAVIAIDL